MFSMKLEPVVLSSLVRGLLLILTGFGLKMTVEEITAIMVAVESIMAVIVRSRVTPNLTVDSKVQNAVNNAISFHSHKGV